ncbi:MAG: hypothetical protein JWQ43_4047, partial [Glaciihabitans sp.]|nr:hypothetical protein [Glaciihabitans sp.]
MKKSIKRWLPAAALPVVIAVAAVAVPAVADASPRLPDKTADEVLALVSASGDTAYSGTIEQSSDLGLPELPSVGGASSGSSDSVSTAMELLTGAHTARVYVDGADASRVQVMDTLAERDVVRNGSDVWFYSSEANEATHVTLADKTDEATAVPDATQTPAELAKQLLASIDPSTTVVVGDTARVAGR